MDNFKLSTAEIRSFDLAKSIETEMQIRREQVLIRMDVYGAGKASKEKALKKSLARVLTVRNMAKK